MTYTLAQFKKGYKQYKENKKRLEELYAANQLNMEARKLDDAINNFENSLKYYLPVLLGEE